MNKILIIDEEALLTIPIIERIKYDFENIEPVHVLTGQAGIEAIQNEKFSVVILDMMLPMGEVDFEYDSSDEMLYGIQILKKLRTIDWKIPIICYTVLDNEIESEIKSLNAIYLRKVEQNSFELLFELIDKYLNY